MSCLPVVVLLSVLSLPCMAETVTEQFSRMDLNNDGFLSEQEFVQGMASSSVKNGIPYTEPAVPTDEFSAAERQKIVDESVAEAKKVLPFKVDQATTWTDVYGGKDEIHYVYRIDMDISAMPEEQVKIMRPVLEMQVCSKIKPAMCGVANNVLLKNGISLRSHYNDRSGRLLAECRFTEADCR